MRKPATPCCFSEEITWAWCRNFAYFMIAQLLSFRRELKEKHVFIDDGKIFSYLAAYFYTLLQAASLSEAKQPGESENRYIRRIHYALYTFAPAVAFLLTLISVIKRLDVDTSSAEPHKNVLGINAHTWPLVFIYVAWASAQVISAYTISLYRREKILPYEICTTHFYTTNPDEITHIKNYLLKNSAAFTLCLVITSQMTTSNLPRPSFIHNKATSVDIWRLNAAWVIYAMSTNGTATRYANHSINAVSSCIEALLASRSGSHRRDHTDEDEDKYYRLEENRNQ